MLDEPVEDQEDNESADGGELSDEELAGIGDGGKNSGSNKKLIMIGGAILLLLGVGAGLYFTGMLDGLLGQSSDETHSEGKDDGHGGNKSGSISFLEIPTIIVNLNAEDGTPRYLRLSVQLELADPSDVAAVEAIMPRVIDQFQTYLRELRVKDLRGSSGIYRLQMELLWRVNQAAAPIEVKDVLFQEILIQ